MASHFDFPIVDRISVERLDSDFHIFVASRLHATRLAPPKHYLVDVMTRILLIGLFSVGSSSRFVLIGILLVVRLGFIRAFAATGLAVS